MPTEVHQQELLRQLLVQAKSRESISSNRTIRSTGRPRSTMRRGRRLQHGLRRTRGPAAAINTGWELTAVQNRIRSGTPSGMRPGSTGTKCPMVPRPANAAPSESAAKERFVEFSTQWRQQYPAITRLPETPRATSCRFWTVTRKPADHPQH